MPNHSATSCSATGRLRAHATALHCRGRAVDTAAAPTLPTHPNPSLVVHKWGNSTLGGWMMPDVRRKHFRTPEFGHQNINMRSSSVLELALAPDDRISAMARVRDSTSHECFCGMVVLRNNEVLFERYHDDFCAETPHSMQSITKTTLNLMVGKLLDEGRLSLDTLVKEVVPEMDSGYADAPLQRVLDMTVSNMFKEGYGDDYWDRSVSAGYARQEIGLGWRLPPPGEQRLGMRAFISAIKRGDERRTSGYKSPNNDLMAWVVERVSGRGIASHLQDIIEATGIEGSFHCACDVDCAIVPPSMCALCARTQAWVASSCQQTVLCDCLNAAWLTGADGRGPDHKRGRFHVRPRSCPLRSAILPARCWCRRIDCRLRGISGRDPSAPSSREGCAGNEHGGAVKPGWMVPQRDAEQWQVCRSRWFRRPVVSCCFYFSLGATCAEASIIASYCIGKIIRFHVPAALV